MHNNKNKSNILQIVPTLNSGGLERGTIDISRASHEAGYNSFVLSKGGMLENKLLDHNAKLIRRNVDTKNIFLMISNMLFIKNLIKNEKINLVHSRSRGEAWSSHYATRHFSIPHITTFHGIYSTKNFIKRYYNSVMTKGDTVIAVSNFVRDHILENYEIDENKIKVIHRGVDFNLYSQDNVSDEQKEKIRLKYRIPTSIPVILVNSRFTRWKGHDLLVKSLNMIKEKDFYCIMVGDLSKHYDYVKEVKDLIVHKKLQSKIQIFGPESDLVSLYNASDIVISPSVEPEAFGKTLIEAQSMKKIVISSDIGATRETIIDDHTGFYFKSGSEKDLADKLCYVLSILGSSKQTDICNNARINIETNFSLSRMLEQTISVYKKYL